MTDRNKWTVGSLHITPKRKELRVSLDGPDKADLNLVVDLPDDWRSLTLAKLEKLSFEKARELYPAK